MQTYQAIRRPSPQRRAQQNHVLNTFFRALSFPLATIVAALFWSVYYYDRELIYPKSWEATNPPHLNQIQHTFPAVSVIADMMLVDHSYSPHTLRLDLSLIASVSISYLCLLTYRKFTMGSWVYSFMDSMSDEVRLAFFIISVLLSFMFYFGGRVGT